MINAIREMCYGDTIETIPLCLGKLRKAFLEGIKLELEVHVAMKT